MSSMMGMPCIICDIIKLFSLAYHFQYFPPQTQPWVLFLFTLALIDTLSLYFCSRSIFALALALGRRLSFTHGDSSNIFQRLSLYFLLSARNIEKDAGRYWKSLHE